MLDKKVFGERVRLLRSGRSAAQDELAKCWALRGRRSGDIENGKTTTSLERLVLLSDYFGVSTDYLLGLTENPEPGAVAPPLGSRPLRGARPA